jgi:2-polyprenyl-3-methyl-5-hydroxy-6-metoxy-1,4-benzoquinol methylase
VSLNVCYELAVRIRRRQAAQGGATGMRHSDPGDYWQWQFDSSAAYFAKCFDLMAQLPGKTILDIGCGLGGRTGYIARAGARRVVGVDINQEEIGSAQRLAAAHLDADSRARLQFIAVREQDPLRSGPYDIVLLIDSLEHVKDPVAMLDLAYSMLRPGGVCYFTTVGWYNHMASHLTGIIPIPFATVFFSDQQILDAVRRIVDDPSYQPTMWDSDPPSARWKGIDNLSDRPGEYLNKITLHGLRRAMRRSRFQGGQLRAAGFTFKRLWPLQVFNVLAKVPLIQEMYHSGCFGRLVKSLTNEIGPGENI